MLQCERGVVIMDETKIFQNNDIQDKLIEQTLLEILDILEERGYDPYKQIVGYLMSEDPGYITSHKEARTRILAFERSQILDFLVRNLNRS